ncbi:MAG: cache domain-containing protein [Gammaproteobacteria bacterium]|jgi:hypothetical protein
MKFHPLKILAFVFCMSHIVIAPSGAQASDTSPCFEEYASTLLSSTIALTEQHIRTVEHELAVLSVTEEVKSADWEKMHSIMHAYQKGGLPGIVWFVLPDGNYYTPEKGLVGNKLNERKYFPGLMSGRRMIGDLVYSRATGRKSVIVAVPVMRDGEVVGGLGASVFLDDLSNRIDAAVSLPENLFFYALAPDGTTTLHKNTQLNFQDPRQQGIESLKLAADRMLSTPEGEVSYEFEGTSRHVIYRTSAFMGWKFAIGIKTDDSGATAGQ